MRLHVHAAVAPTNPWPVACPQLLQFLKHHGVKKLGSARVPASELQRLGLGPRSRTLMLTRGSDTLTLDWKADWGVTPLPEEGSDTGAETDHGNDAVRRALSGSATGAAAHTAPPAVVVAVPHTGPAQHQHPQRHSRDDQEAGPSRGSGDASSRGKSLWGQLRCAEAAVRGRRACGPGMQYHPARPPDASNVRLCMPART